MIFSRPPPVGQNGAAQNEEDIEEILQQYDTEPDMTLEGGLRNSLGNRDQDQVTEDAEPLDLGAEDSEPLDLGAIRKKTRYSLRQKPVRNKRYFWTTLEGNYDNITDLRELPVVQRKRKRNGIINEKKHAPKILKLYILPKCYKLKEINSLDVLPLDHT